MSHDHHDDPVLPDELSQVAQRLAGWRPGAPGLDRDRLLYEAGRSSRRGGRLSLFGAMAAIAVIAVGLGFANQVRNRTRLAREQARAQLVLAQLAQQQAITARLQGQVQTLRTVLAARPTAPGVDGPLRSPTTVTIELSPSSYMALTRGFAEEGRLAPEPATFEEAGGRDGVESSSPPLRVRDAARVRF